MIPSNPFITRGYAGPEYFCDRVKETETLTRYLQNGNNVFLTSHRRLGKSGLIDHCFMQEEIQRDYITIHVDIYATKNLSEFVNALGSAVLGALKSRGRIVWEGFLNVLSSLKSTITFDINGMPEWGIGIGEITAPSITLSEIFSYLENAPKRCLVAIDEFQTIAKYPEDNTEALLRTYIQRMQNVCFVFAGSQRHMLSEMFTSSSRPFYMSSAPLTIDALDRELYYEFAEQHFHDWRKRLSQDAFNQIYDMFEGTTWYIQFMLNVAFSQTLKECEFSISDMNDVLNTVLDTFDSNYKNMLYQLPAKQKEVFLALTYEGKAENITSKSFLRKYKLTASAMQAAVRALLEKDLVTCDTGIYQVCDKFFPLWAKRNM